MLKGACMTPREQVYMNKFNRHWFYFIAIGGWKYFLSFHRSAVQKLDIFCHTYFI